MKFFFIFLIKLYKRFISPFKPQCCRFYPTCSSYAIEAISKFGTLRGSYLAVRRLLKCHPYNKGGIDYVPENFHNRLKQLTKENTFCKTKKY